MTADGADRVAVALDSLDGDFGIDLLEEPARGLAVVADLVGDPRYDTHDQFAALRMTTTRLIEDGVSRGDQVDPGPLHRLAAAEEIPEGVARATIELVAEHLDLELGSPGGRGWLRPGALAAVAAVLAIGLAIVLWPDPDPDEEDDPTATTTEEATGSSVTEPPETTAPTTERDTQPGITATFEEVREGPFLVRRGWRVTPTGAELVGIVRLTAAGDSAASATHTELAPRSAIDDPASVVWGPEPATIVNSLARYNVDVGVGELFEIEFRAPLRAGDLVTEADVLAWFDVWQTDVGRLRPLGESDQLIAPLVETDE